MHVMCLCIAPLTTTAALSEVLLELAVQQHSSTCINAAEQEAAQEVLSTPS